jgi:hypothetical protein
LARSSGANFKASSSTCLTLAISSMLSLWLLSPNGRALRARLSQSTLRSPLSRHPLESPATR